MRKELMTPIEVLLVDDDVDFAESLAELLEIRGFAVSVANSGLAALEKVREGDFDLVFLDMKMPGMNGIECLTRMRKIRPGIQVMMVTAFTHSEFIRQAISSGAMAVLGKPVIPEEILQTISYIGAEASILVVEDDGELAAELTRLLEEQNYSVNHASNLAAARDALLNRNIDLVLLNFRLPDGTAVEFLDWMKSVNVTRNVVLITGYAEEAMADLPLVSVEATLVKPFNPDILLDTLRRLHPQQVRGGG